MSVVSIRVISNYIENVSRGMELVTEEDFENLQVLNYCELNISTILPLLQKCLNLQSVSLEHCRVENDLMKILEFKIQQSNNLEYLLEMMMIPQVLNNLIFSYLKLCVHVYDIDKINVNQWIKESFESWENWHSHLNINFYPREYDNRFGLPSGVIKGHDHRVIINSESFYPGIPHFKYYYFKWQTKDKWQTKNTSDCRSDFMLSCLRKNKNVESRSHYLIN